MTEALGRWVLVDLLNKDQYGLLSIGDVNYSGASLRKSLAAQPRELLVDRIRRVAESAQRLEEVVEHRGEKFTVVVEPVLSPTNRYVVAARAIFTPAAKPVPERPLIGSVEWKIMDGGARIESVWDDNMFELYGVTRKGEGSATGDMSQWIGSLIAPEDRARMKVIIDGGIAAPDGQRHLVPYRIITGADTDNPGSRHLEASGRIFVEDGGSVKWLRSITRETSELNPAVAPANVDMSSGGLLRATFELARDSVMIAVDTQWWQIFMTSPMWKDYGLRNPRYGYLPHVVHPDDATALLEMCEKAQPNHPPLLIRFLHTDGTYQRYEVTSSNGHAGTEKTRYIVASLRPTEYRRRLSDWETSQN